jgi:hypothetical protein
MVALWCVASGALAAAAPAVAGSVLLDGRGWELVSPVGKNGGSVLGVGGGVLRAGVGGGVVVFGSVSSFGVGGGAPGVSEYVSRRGADGWLTENVSVPLVSGGFPGGGGGVPYQAFSDDLSLGLLSAGGHCRNGGTGCAVANPPLPGSGAPAGYEDYYVRDGSNGGYVALLTRADAPALVVPPEYFDLEVAGATPDLSHVVLSTCAALTGGVNEVAGVQGCDSEEENLYEWSNGTLVPVNVLPGQEAASPPARLAAVGGAVSVDGSRVFWSDPATGGLYVRDGGVRTVQVDAGVGGGGVFQAASTDGSVAFFMKTAHLYRYELSGEMTTDITPGGEVVGVLGASADGSYVYYLSGSGVWSWHNGVTVQVASAADPGNVPAATGTSRVSADGRHVVFESSASLTGYDNAGFSEVYLFDAPTGHLTCVSCDPTGEEPLGGSSIPGAVGNGEGESEGVFAAYKPRVLSQAGTRVFFDSRDALVAGDTDNRQDVYEWEAQGTGSCVKAGGCVGLISGGRGSEDSSFADANADGSDVFFLTGDSLIPSDPGAVDLYDARVGGGFPVPVPAIPCTGDACQPPALAPEDTTPGTETYQGPGNPAAPNPPLKKPKKKQKKHARKKAKGKAKKAGGRGARARAGARAGSHARRVSRVGGVSAGARGAGRG